MTYLKVFLLSEKVHRYASYSNVEIAFTHMVRSYDVFFMLECIVFYNIYENVGIFHHSLVNSQ